MKVTAVPPQDLSQLEDKLVEMTEHGQGREAVRLALALLQETSESLASLQLQLIQANRRQFGSKSQHLDPAQLNLFQHLLDLVEQNQDLLPGPAKVAAPEKREPRRHPHGRAPLPADLPREVQRIEVPAAEKLCPVCGEERVHIRDEVSEVLEYIPAQF